jgi:hypothetical protein
MTARDWRLKLAGNSPAAQRDKAPNGFYDSEGPRSLQKTVNGTQCARDGEPENIPPASFFQRVTNQHRNYSEETKNRESIHV